MKKPRTKTPKIDVQQLKPKRRRIGKNVRSLNHTCPNCLSTIIINDLGQWQCTGDKLKIWTQEFSKYKKMTDRQKEQYLLTLDNKDKFLEWFQQKELQCGWTSAVQKQENTYSIRIPDPMAVGRLERSLGRTLEGEDLEEGKLYYRKLYGGKFCYSEQQHEGWHPYLIPRVSFPDDV